MLGIGYGRRTASSIWLMKLETLMTKLVHFVSPKKFQMNKV
jgi:hypothetical protein